MNDYKDIDKLFQEKLKDFEVSPKPQVWQNIEQKLKKKKRRVLPMWWLSGGIAAILVLGLFLYPAFIKGTKDIPVKTEPIIVLESEDSIKRMFDEKELLHKKVESKIEVVLSKESENTNASQLITEQKTVLKKQKNNVFDKKRKLTNNNETLKVINENNNVAQKEKESTTINNEGLKLVDKNAMEKIFSTENRNVANKKDSLPLLKPKQNFIVAMAKKDSIKSEEKYKKEWSFSPVVASIKSNSFSGASPIGKDFKNNEASGSNTYSYGIKVAYQLNDKWAIQSGVYLQNIGYTTKGVTLASSGFVKAGTSFISLSDNSSIDGFNASPNTNGIDKSGIISSNAELQQTLKYTEIPIEIKYTVFKSKNFNTSLVTGFSSLILTSNTIKAKASNFFETIGEANNLNTINFSGNLGVDFNYSFSRKWTLNVNPMFKTQINTFSKNSNGFRPYSIGIYTGFTYKF